MCSKKRHCVHCAFPFGHVYGGANGQQPSCCMCGQICTDTADTEYYSKFEIGEAIRIDVLGYLFTTSLKCATILLLCHYYVFVFGILPSLTVLGNNHHHHPYLWRTRYYIPSRNDTVNCSLNFCCCCYRPSVTTNPCVHRAHLHTFVVHVIFILEMFSLSMEMQQVLSGGQTKGVPR